MSEDMSTETFVSLTFKRRHVRRLVICPDGDASPQRAIDTVLLQALAKAFYWQRLLDTGQARDAAEIAQRFGVRSAWVSEIMRLTRLSPAILTAISRGTQPRWWTLQTLRGRPDQVSLNWREQGQALGFSCESRSSFGGNLPCATVGGCPTDCRRGL